MAVVGRTFTVVLPDHNPMRYTQALSVKARPCLLLQNFKLAKLLAALALPRKAQAAHDAARSCRDRSDRVWPYFRKSVICKRELQRWPLQGLVTPSQQVTKHDSNTDRHGPTRMHRTGTFFVECVIAATLDGLAWLVMSGGA